MAKTRRSDPGADGTPEDGGAAPGPPPDPTVTPEPTEHRGRAPSKVAVAQRVEEVLRIRLDGAEFHDIVQFSSEQKWNVGERQLWKYIHRADALIVERQTKGRRKLLARHFTQRRSLYARSLNAGDYRTCLAILADDAKLRGLYPDPKDLKDWAKLAAHLADEVAALKKREAHAARGPEGESEPNEAGGPGTGSDPSGTTPGPPQSLPG